MNDKWLALMLVFYVWPVICLSVTGMILSASSDSQDPYILSALIGAFEFAGFLAFTALYRYYMIRTEGAAHPRSGQEWRQCR